MEARPSVEQGADDGVGGVFEGLRRVVAERKRAGGFRLRKASFRGNGLQPDVADASWERIRELAYDKRGG